LKVIQSLHEETVQ